ncbi:MAG: 16S rRNA (cytosine(967)-C(5))-methyltransferase RsmB [Nitrospirae bacterium]|nr:16S rRNA (cytosine(967)-C(5))-methyltransferase RsmB [Nitrospirota bacterium]
MRSSSPPHGSPQADPRQIALTILHTLEQTQAMADDVIAQAFQDTTLNRRDRALVMEVVYGVLRHRSALDWRLNRHAAKSVDRLPALVRSILRLGAYQLSELTRIPPHAVIDTAVTLAKRVRRGPDGHWGGFVNAVLRAVSREPKPPWPDPVDDPSFALAVRYSCPAWLVTRWVQAFGVPEAERLCDQTLETPPLTLRANTLRTTRVQLADSLRNAGREFQLCKVSPVGLHVTKQGPVTELPGYVEGHFYVEDEAAQLIPLLLDPQPGERVLDACAAPGGKTTHLATLMQNRGTVVAVDRDPARLARVHENARRLGISIIDAVEADLAQGRSGASSIDRAAALQSRFDRVLVDAPCSALGVLRRHPEAKWRKAPDLIGEAQALQLAILDQAACLLRAGGVMVYSTCSTEPDENERVVDLFCQTHPEFSRERVTPWLPPNGVGLVTARGEFSTRLNCFSMDVFFAARLRKAPA